MNMPIQSMAVEILIKVRSMLSLGVTFPRRIQKNSLHSTARLPSRPTLRNGPPNALPTTQGKAPIRWRRLCLPLRRQLPSLRPLPRPLVQLFCAGVVRTLEAYGPASPLFRRGSNRLTGRFSKAITDPENADEQHGGAARQSEPEGALSTLATAPGDDIRLEANPEAPHAANARLWRASEDLQAESARCDAGRARPRG
jgi:hypothetical protein